MTGKADGEPSTERLQVFQKEFGGAAAVAQPHLIECIVQQAADLIEIRGGGDELKATEVFTLRRTVDDVGIVDLPVVSREISVFSTGDPPPPSRWRATALCVAFRRRASVSVCVRRDGCFSPSEAGGTALIHTGEGRLE